METTKPVMSHVPIEQPRDRAPGAGPAERAEPQTPAAPDERDLAIERLERALTEERAHAATLRARVEELRFKNEILERSYSKQLADARRRAETAENSLAGHEARIAELESDRAQSMRLLGEARAELEQFSGLRHRSRPGIVTMDELMQDSSWLPKQPEVHRENGHLDTKVRPEPEDPAEDMLAPELMFTGRGRRDD